MDYVLETMGLSKRYKNQWALKDVNMHVEKGDVYGFVGENGSGKTTVIRLITGLIFPTERPLQMETANASIERAIAVSTSSIIPIFTSFIFN